MGFQEFKIDYLKTTIPENKVSKLKTIGSIIDKDSLSFFATQYKNESDGKVRAAIINVVSKNLPEISAP